MYLPENLELLYTPDQIQQKVIELAEQISIDYVNKELHLVGVLKGSFIFLADLARALRGQIYVHFLHASSYASTQSTGKVEIRHGLRLKNKHVLLVEDILDTGLTSSQIIKDIQMQHPASMKVCTFLSKRGTRQVSVETDYVGYTIDNHFVVGYGMDMNEKYRELSYIAYLKDAPSDND